MAETTITFSVDAELNTQFGAAAETNGQSSAALLRDLMQVYVMEQRKAPGYDAWFKQKVEGALASARRGDLIPHEEVRAEFAALRADTRRKFGL